MYLTVNRIVHTSIVLSDFRINCNRITECSLLFCIVTAFESYNKKLNFAESQQKQCIARYPLLVHRHFHLARNGVFYDYYRCHVWQHLKGIDRQLSERNVPVFIPEHLC
jgi:hypothetical protein